MISTQAAPDALPGTLVPFDRHSHDRFDGRAGAARPSGCWSPTVRHSCAPAFARCWRPAARSASSGRRLRARKRSRWRGRLRPDVVLIDATLPGLDCVLTTGRILSDPGIAVMLLTATELDHRSFAALRAGARGLLLKDTDPAELVRAIELLARGDALLSPSLTRRLIAELASIPDPQLPSSELLDELTPREREVVGLVALGLSNADIAERLVISPATSKTHVSRAMLKLGAHDRAQLVVFAFHAGLAVPRIEAAAAPHALALARAS
jgi:DNA-binding NarL/FixJ family response regulator